MNADVCGLCRLFFCISNWSLWLPCNAWYDILCIMTVTDKYFAVSLCIMWKKPVITNYFEVQVEQSVNQSISHVCLSVLDLILRHACSACHYFGTWTPNLVHWFVSAEDPILLCVFMSVVCVFISVHIYIFIFIHCH